MRITIVQLIRPKRVAVIRNFFACVLVSVALTSFSAVAVAQISAVQSTLSDDTTSPTAKANSDKTGTDKISPAKAGTEPKSTPSSNGPVQVTENKKRALQNRRQVVMGFLKEHFPALQKSLLKSEKHTLKKFRNAISQLEEDVLRLKDIEKTHPQKFQLSVDQWTLKTQIEMTIARYAKKENDKQLEERLRPLVEEMLDLRKLILEMDQQIVTERLESLDKHLLNFENRRELVTENSLNRLIKSAEQIRRKYKGKTPKKQSEQPKNKTKTN